MVDGDLAARIRTLVDTTDPVTVEEVSRTRRRARPTPRALAVVGIVAVVVAAVIVAVVHHRSATSTVVSLGVRPVNTSSSVTRGPLTVTLRLDRTVVPTDSVLWGELIIDNRGPTIRRRGECFAIMPTLFLATPPVFEPGESCGEPAHGAPMETISHGLTTVPVSTETASAGRYLAVIALEPLVYAIPVPPAIPVRVVSTGLVTTRLVLSSGFVHAGDLDPAALVIDNHSGRTVRLGGCRFQAIDYSFESQALNIAPGNGEQGMIATCVRQLRPGLTRVSVTISTTFVPCVPPGPASSAGCRSHHVPALRPGPWDVAVTAFAGYPAWISLPDPVPVTLTP